MTVTDESVGVGRKEKNAVLQKTRQENKLFWSFELFIPINNRIFLNF